MIALLLACAAPPPAEPVGPAFERVSVAVGELTLDLATARLDPDGSGGGEQARATAPELVVTAARSDWSLAAATVTFTGEVRATRGPVVLTADTLVLRWAGDHVASAAADGHVRVVHGARSAGADHADLDGPSGRLTLTGAPVLEEAGRRLTGEVLTLYLDDERMTCDRCRLTVPGDALP